MNMHVTVPSRREGNKRSNKKRDYEFTNLGGLCKNIDNKPVEKNKLFYFK